MAGRLAVENHVSIYFCLDLQKLTVEAWAILKAM